MNLLTKLQLKLYNIDMPQIKFDDYAEQYGCNLKIIQKNSKKVINDYKKYAKCENFDYYISQIYDQDINLTPDVQKLCNDRILAQTITSTVFYTKIYILFYLSTQKGKDVLNISKTISRLDFLSDNLAFEIIRYLSFNEEIWVEFDKEHKNFNVSAPIKNSDLFKLIIKILNFINHANFLIYKGDEEELKKLYNSFDFGNLVNDSFDIFGMNDNSDIYRAPKEEKAQNSSQNL